MKKKKWIKCGLLTLMMIGLSPLNVFAGSASVRTWVSLTCDTLKLKPGDVATCTVTLRSNALLTGYTGEVITSDGLKVDSISSKSDDYTVTQKGNQFELQMKEAIPNMNAEVVEIKVSAEEEFSGNKGSVTVKTLLNCETGLKGDMNLDGKLTYSDISPLCGERTGISINEILAKQAGGYTPTADELLRGDMDNDGVISIADTMEAFKRMGDLNDDGILDNTDVEILEGWVTAGNATRDQIDLVPLSTKSEEQCTVFQEDVDSLKERVEQGVQLKKEYINSCTDNWVGDGIDGTTAIMEFEVTPADEVVDVPDTASSIPVWYYVVGAVFMAFGVYLIVEARRKNQVQ